MTDFDALRTRMVETQLKPRGITDERVLEAMATVPREAFLPDTGRLDAYEDRPLPIGGGQTISQPYIVALMAEFALVEPGARVLDVGLGSGYAAAVLAQMGAEVFAIERRGDLARRAEKTLRRLGYSLVTCRTGDGTLGWPEAAPFDAILVAAAGPATQALREQLKIGGRLIIPVPVGGGRQELRRLTRCSEDTWDTETIGGVSFVPLLHGEA
jgi:protein-L-isoaspartate(D-aspartate) O-methyltransferase